MLRENMKVRANSNCKSIYYTYPEIIPFGFNLNSKFLASFICKIYIMSDLPDGWGGDPWASRKSGGFSAYFLINHLNISSAF